MPRTSDRLRWINRVVLVLAAIFSSFGAERVGTVGPRKVDSELARALKKRSESSKRVIIRTAPGARDRVRARLRQGDAEIGEHVRIDGLSAELTLDAVQALASDPEVLSLSSDAVVTGATVTYDFSNVSARESLMATLGVSDSPLTGDHIGIAVIDSGLAESKDLDGAQVDEFYDFTKSHKKSRPYDDYGHGTHVAGLIASSGELSRRQVNATGSDGRLHKVDLATYGGVASHARIISLKALDANGAGHTSTVIEAIEFAIDNKQRLGIDVINLSLGHPILEPAATDPLVQAVEAAVRAGIIVVASAGNYGTNPETLETGYAGITSPGNAPSAITVGALDTKQTVTRSDDSIPDYSSRGPTWYDALTKPDLVAPGHRLVSDAAYAATLTSTRSGSLIADRDGKPQYLRLSGTSMSAAVTSGVVALMLEAHNKVFKTPLPPNSVKAMLEYRFRSPGMTASRRAPDPSTGMGPSNWRSRLIQRCR
jgi:serine protease AprX